MRHALNGWRRLWIVFSVILLGPFALILSLEWPIEDHDILRQLDAPECAALRSLPDGSHFQDPPEYGVPCYDLLRYDYTNGVILHRAADYKHALARSRANTALGFFAAWLTVAVVVYALGAAIAWVRHGFRSVRASP